MNVRMFCEKRSLEHSIFHILHSSTRLHMSHKSVTQIVEALGFKPSIYIEIVFTEPPNGLTVLVPNTLRPRRLRHLETAAASCRVLRPETRSGACAFLAGIVSPYRFDPI